MPDTPCLKETAAMSQRLAYGGKTVYSARLGILMLDVKTPRIPGDVGNAETWPFPVLYGVMRGASPHKAINERGANIMDAVFEAAERLVDQGADGIATTGGHLSIFQKPLSERVKVPVATSSLMQIPLVEALLPPGRRVGVVTSNSEALDADRLKAAGAREDTPTAGVQNGREFYRVFHNGLDRIDLALAEQDVVDASLDLVRRRPDVGAIVFECHNFAPFAPAVRDALNMPVYSVYTFFTWFYAGLAPRDFGHPSSAHRAWRESGRDRA
jgi:hypothetical protein